MEKEQKKPKVVFTFVEAGMGHIIPITGMYEAFKAKYSDKCEVVKSYIFSASENEKVRAMGKELSDHTKHTASSYLYNRLEAFSYLLSSKFNLKILDAHFKYAKNDFLNELKQLNPDLIVSTYYLPSHFAHLSNEKGLTDTLIATYSCDPYIYPAWDRVCDLYMVNNSTAFNSALKKGFKKEQVRQVPFVYKKAILDIDKDKDTYRKELNLDDKFTVLFTGGAYGAKGTEKYVKTLLTSNLDINLIVVCGSNKEMKVALEKFDAIKSKCTNFYLLGFTDKMGEYMKASDIMIGKAGMNTGMEGVYLDCPMIVNAEANRLEEHIAKFFLKEKIAEKRHNSKKAVKLIKEYMQNPQLLKERVKGFDKFKDSTGAEKSADLLFELLKKKYPNI